MNVSQLEHLTLIASGMDADRLRLAQQYAERWFGPECVRLEVKGEAATEYDDERTSVYGDRGVQGFNQDGLELDELLVKGDPDFEGSYFDALAEWQEEDEEERGDAPEGEPQEDSWEYDFHEGREALISDYTGLHQGYYYWGEPEKNPYAADQAKVRGLS